jgi:hypothetical protein
VAARVATPYRTGDGTREATDRLCGLLLLLRPLLSILGRVCEGKSRQRPNQIRCSLGVDAPVIPFTS